METGSTQHKTAGTMNAKPVLCFSLLSIIHFSASAQGQPIQAESSSVLSNPLFIVLLSIIILLLIVIIVFADLVKSSVDHKREQDKERGVTNSPIIKTLITLFMIGGMPDSLFAQTGPTLAVEQNFYDGLDGFTFYLLLSIIAFEILVVWMLYKVAMQLLGIDERKSKKEEEKTKSIVKQTSFIEKINASVAVEEEAEIMLDHNYDGIRELDNNLPPWWKYGFYITIVWAVIYLVHYHVTGTGKLQQAEYEDQLTLAKYEMEEYRKKAANLVDENNATVLTDEASLTSGKSIYMDNCAACHGRAGEGGVGPNLTDDYWFHNGGIKDIFKTIKYGYPERGMKGWQQDLGSKQIHDVSSYVKSLQGTNPPNAKEKQGELYQEEMGDSTKIMTADTMQVLLEGK